MTDKKTEQDKSNTTLLKTGHYKLEAKPSTSDSIKKVFGIWKGTESGFWKDLNVKDALDWNWEEGQKHEWRDWIKKIENYLSRGMNLENSQAFLDGILWTIPTREDSKRLKIYIREYPHANLTKEAKERFDKIFDIYVNMQSELNEMRSNYLHLYYLGVNQINDLIIKVGEIENDLTRQYKRRKKLNG
jgi:hypothetical protein